MAEILPKMLWLLCLLPLPVLSARTRVAVVGAGVGGLVVASRLAQQGLDVSLFERNSNLGGRMQSETLGEYRSTPACM